MKQVILEYAGAVIAVLGALSFFVIFNHFFVGSDGVLGGLLMYSIGEETMTENQAFDAYQAEGAPQIAVKEGITLIANQSMKLSDCFEAWDAKGQIVPVYVKGAWDCSGVEKNLASSAEDSICAPAAGIYWIEVYAVDDEGRSASHIVKLLVNER